VTRTPTKVSGAPTKADEIALVLENAILAGELEPGTVLRQEQLSEEFGVSRTPIREALRSLEALGLVTMAGNRGVQLRLPSREELRETCIMRAALEGFAAHLARDKMNASRMKRMKQAERRFAELTHTLRSSEGDELRRRALAAEWVRANEAIHDVFLDAAGAAQLAAAARRTRRVFHGQAVWSSSGELSDHYTRNVEQHAEIVQAFATGDPLVRELVERHVLDSGRLLDEALDDAGYGRRKWLGERVSWNPGEAV